MCARVCTMDKYESSMMSEFFFERDIQKAQRTPAQQVSYYIKKKLLHRELRPGDRIPTEDELCQKLDVSRTSVREALKSLSAINLITIRRGDGTYISNPEDITFSEAFLFKMLLSNSSMEELLTFREHMEMAVMQTAMINISPEQVEALHDNLIRFDQCILEHPEDSAELHRLDVEFHALLAQATGNKLIEEIYKVAIDLFSPTILQNYADGQTLGLDAVSTQQSHRLLYEGLVSKNVNLCTYAVWYSLKLWYRWIEHRKKDDGDSPPRPGTEGSLSEDAKP